MLGVTRRNRVVVGALVAAALVLVVALVVRPGSRHGLISPWQAVVLGTVEGLTEYLPVSSTGHLILASHAMGLSEFGDRSGPFGREVEKGPAVSAFEIVIQLGAILAVLGLYRRRVGQMGLGLIGRDRQGLRLFKLLLVSFLPAAVVGLALHKPIQEHLFGPLTVALALIAGGALMIGLEALWKRRGRAGGGAGIDQLACWQALAIGLAQVLAMWPGTSRSMVTIVAAMIVGLSRVSAAEYSFLLALPTLGAATLYEAVGSRHELFTLVGWDALLIGTIVSALVAAVAVKLLVTWLNNHGLTPFGVYRIALGGALLWYFRGVIL